MYELVQVGRQTYYIDCPAKMGVYVEENSSAYLIDSGNDKEAGKKALKVLAANGWELKGVINTHSNADHVGGNALLQQRTGCKVISTGLENAFARFPLLEPSFLYGGYPCRPLRNKFLMAQASAPTDDVEAFLPQGLSFFRLGGHYFDMIGIRTPDDVYFLADCMFGEAILHKYHLSFIYDVEAFLRTLDWVESLSGSWFVPAHAPAVRDIRPLACANREKVREIIGRILAVCGEPHDFEEILKALFDGYGLTMDFNQYVLVGSTVRSYLSYLSDQGLVRADFTQNRLLWQTCEKE